jgi:5-methylcytosine-specific restriction endonuclease McrA
VASGKHFVGAPCPAGHTTRYVSTKRCVECAASANRSWVAANPERMATLQADWYEKHAGELLEKRAAYYAATCDLQAAQARARRAKNPEAHKARDAVYRAARDRDALNGYAAKWRQENPSKVAAVNSRRRAAKKAASGTILAVEIEALMEGACCNYCLSAERLERDHVVPLARGGSDTLANSQVLCRSCNASKNTKNHDEYMDYLGVIGRASVLQQILNLRSPAHAVV